MCMLMCVCRGKDYFSESCNETFQEKKKKQKPTKSHRFSMYCFPQKQYIEQ